MSDQDEELGAIRAYNNSQGRYKMVNLMMWLIVGGSAWPWSRKW